MKVILAILSIGLAIALIISSFTLELPKETNVHHHVFDPFSHPQVRPSMMEPTVIVGSYEITFVDSISIVPSISETKTQGAR